MFSFQKWQDWLASYAGAPQREKVAVTFRATGDNVPLPGMGLELEGQHALASFRSWSNGYVDYEVAVYRHGEWQIVVNEAMIEVDDQSFEAIFRTFLSQFQETDVPAVKQ